MDKDSIKEDIRLGEEQMAIQSYILEEDDKTARELDRAYRDSPYRRQILDLSLFACDEV